MSRRELSLLVTRPNDALVGSVDGLFRFAWFRKLKTSILNWNDWRSFTTTFLNSAMSHWYWPGPYMLLRGALPNVPFAGRAYAAGLNQRFGSVLLFESWPLVFALGSPTRLNGCANASPTPAMSSPRVTHSGVPVRMNVEPEICHPP